MSGRLSYGGINSLTFGGGEFEGAKGSRQVPQRVPFDSMKSVSEDFPFTVATSEYLNHCTFSLLFVADSLPVVQLFSCLTYCRDGYEGMLRV